MRLEFRETPIKAELARRHNISIDKVYGYLKLDIQRLRDRLQKLDKPLALDRFGNIVYKMIADNFESTAILKSVQKLDPNVNPTFVKDYIKTIAKRYFDREIVDARVIKKKLKNEYVAIRRIDIVKFITIIHHKKSTKIRRHWPLLKTKFPILRELEKIYRFFSNCLAQTDTTLLDRYLSVLDESSCKDLLDFAKSIRKDKVAIQNAISTQITSGLVEGGNNKIKLIKRQAYGRIKLPRLKNPLARISFLHTITHL